MPMLNLALVLVPSLVPDPREAEEGFFGKLALWMQASGSFVRSRRIRSCQIARRERRVRSCIGMSSFVRKARARPLGSFVPRANSFVQKASAAGLGSCVPRAESVRATCAAGTCRVRFVAQLAQALPTVLWLSWPGLTGPSTRQGTTHSLRSKRVGSPVEPGNDKRGPGSNRVRYSREQGRTPAGGGGGRAV